MKEWVATEELRFVKIGLHIMLQQKWARVGTMKDDTNPKNYKWEDVPMVERE